MLIVFEGIDGSGKTTLSNKVAKQLVKHGARVRHVREGGKLASPTAEAIRLLARDQRNAALSPMAEMLLYAARDAQQLEEVMRPAFVDADIVIADRFAYTALLMATAGRGLPEDVAQPVVTAIAGGITPDLVILVDVEPHVARARRRVGKMLEPTNKASSRKGLSGEGLMLRLREGYLKFAEKHSDRWITVTNSDADLEATVAALVQAIETLPAGGVAAAREVLAQRPTTVTPPLSEPEPKAALAAYLAYIDRRTTREPAVAAYLLGGLAGPDFDERRRALALVAPVVIASGLNALDDPQSWEFRHTLAEVAPSAIIRSLSGPAVVTPGAWELREQLLSVAPAEVATSLRRVNTPKAWELRERLAKVVPAAVTASLTDDESPRAWRWREAWLAETGGDEALADPIVARTICQSISGSADPRAWAWRRLALAAAPASALASLGELTSDEAWAWRSAWLDRAPRAVLRNLDGLDHEIAYELRERAAKTAPEAIVSLRGLTSARADALRVGAIDRWPVAVAKSLAGPLAKTERGQELMRTLLSRHPANVPLWKQAAARLTMPDTAPVDHESAG